MATSSPLNQLHQQAEAAFTDYGPASASREGAPPPARIVETFGELEGEYAAIRKGCVLLDLPQRGTLRITGADRLHFLNRMVTQDLAAARPFQVRESFWLNRKGRIVADLRLIETPADTLIDVDLLAAERAAHTLSAFVITEDVTVADESERTHRLALHGPAAPRLAHEVSTPTEGPAISDLSPGQATVVTIAGRRVVADRHDPTGEPGIELLMRVEDVHAVYEQLLERGLDAGAIHGHPAGALSPARSLPAFKMRPAGWHAFNIARIEAGTPLYNIDFGPESLPAETGVMSRRVSMTKGCYLGQEIVARMHSLGHPRQTLVALRIGPAARSGDHQPPGGATLWREDDQQRTPVGAVTSSARSPMLGDQPVCFAQVRWGAHEPGARLLVDTPAGPAPATVQPSLTFWSRDR